MYLVKLSLCIPIINLMICVQLLSGRINHQNSFWNKCEIYQDSSKQFNRAIPTKGIFAILPGPLFWKTDKIFQWDAQLFQEGWSLLCLRKGWDRWCATLWPLTETMWLLFHWKTKDTYLKVGIVCETQYIIILITIKWGYS